LTGAEAASDNTAMRISAAFAILSALLAYPAAAQQPRQSAEMQRLGEFIRSPAHLEQVRAALQAFEPTVFLAECAEVRPTKGVRWQPFQEPVFEAGASAPRTALWQETWEVSLCGKTGLRSVSFEARAGQGIIPRPMFPGESLADVRDQLDAGTVALSDIAPGVLPCNERGRIQVINSMVTNRGDASRTRWSERWTVAGCNRRAEIDVDFTRSPQGRTSFEFRNRARR
jgi:hypothetical protein